MHNASQLHNRCRSKAIISRRQLLQAGLTGFTTLSMADVFRLQAAAKSMTAAPRTAVIMVWLRGGASHLETFDPKPAAPPEFRGPYSAIDTNVPGIQICELLPRLSKIADKYAILRSIAHTGGGHPAGSLQVLAGDPDAQDKLTRRLPDWMSIADFVRHDSSRNLPNYVAINPVDRYDNFTIAGPSYLGPSRAPFAIVGDPSNPAFEVPNVGLAPDQQERLERRMQLKSGFDILRRDLDTSGTLTAVAAHFRLGFRRIDGFVTHSSCLTLYHHKSIRGI